MAELAYALSSFLDLVVDMGGRGESEVVVCEGGREDLRWVNARERRERRECWSWERWARVVRLMPSAS
jgi:hypothetical protein